MSGSEGKSQPQYHHHQVFRLRTQSTVDDGPQLVSREGQEIKKGISKGKVIGVFTSGGDSQGKSIY